MFTVTNPLPEFESLNERCQDLLEQILSAVQLDCETIKLRANTPLRQLDPKKDFFYILKEGNLSYNLKDKILFYYQEGDLLGVEKETDIFEPVISSDFTVVLDRYSQKNFLSKIYDDNSLLTLWHEYLGRYIAALYVVARSMFKDTKEAMPDVKTYHAGEVIIPKDSISDQVITLADGKAQIVSNGQVIGELQADSVIGLICAITNSRMKVSVVAKTDCLVLSMSCDSYLNLLPTKPILMSNIISDLVKNVEKNDNHLAGDLIKL